MSPLFPKRGSGQFTAQERFNTLQGAHLPLTQEIFGMRVSYEEILPWYPACV